MIITDLGVLRLDPESREFKMASLHPGVSREQAAESTGWDLAFADDLTMTPPPTGEELQVLRDLEARTARAHGGADH